MKSINKVLSHLLVWVFLGLIMSSTSTYAMDSGDTDEGGCTNPNLCDDKGNRKDNKPSPQTPKPSGKGTSKPADPPKCNSMTAGDCGDE